MKTSEQSPKQASQQLHTQRKNRNLSIKDNRPESLAQAQLLAAVHSRESLPLVSLVGQGRAGFSPAMIQKKGVVQRERGQLVINGYGDICVLFVQWLHLIRDFLQEKNIEIISCERYEDRAIFNLSTTLDLSNATDIIKKEFESFSRYVRRRNFKVVAEELNGRLKMETDSASKKKLRDRVEKPEFNPIPPKIAGEEIKTEAKKEEMGEVPLSPYMLKDKPSNEIIEFEKTEDAESFLEWIKKKLKAKTIRYNNKIIVEDTIYTDKGLLTEYNMRPKGFSGGGLGQNILKGLPKENDSSLYLVGQGLFAVGTGKDFPGGFFTDGAGPCVAIAIKCEKDIFALGHFDSDVNGGEKQEDPYDEEKIESAIRRLYGLMIAKNSNREDLGKVEVVLTRGDSWSGELYAIYMDCITKYFGDVRSQRLGTMGAYVNKDMVSGFNGNHDVYENSLKNKDKGNVLKFIDSLHPQSIPLGCHGVESLTVLSQMLKSECKAIANKSVGIATIFEAVKGQKNTKNEVERIKKIEEKIHNLSVEAKVALPELMMHTNKLEGQMKQIKDMIQEDDQFLIQSEPVVKDIKKEINPLKTGTKSQKKIYDAITNLLNGKTTTTDLDSCIAELGKDTTPSVKKGKGTISIEKITASINNSKKILDNRTKILQARGEREQQITNIFMQITNLKNKIRQIEMLVQRYGHCP